MDKFKEKFSLFCVPSFSLMLASTGSIAVSSGINFKSIEEIFTGSIIFFLFCISLFYLKRRFFSIWNAVIFIIAACCLSLFSAASVNKNLSFSGKLTEKHIVKATVASVIKRRYFILEERTPEKQEPLLSVQWALSARRDIMLPGQLLT